VKQQTPAIFIFNHQKDLKIARHKEIIRSLIVHISRAEKVSFDEVGLHFVSDRAMRKLHNAHFQDPTSTDCISFPIDSREEKEYTILGEIVVCPKTAIEYAKTKKLDPYLELMLYIIHGMLHLLGYDDIEQKDRALMRRKERKYIHWLKEKLRTTSE
jgi:probable rRNA maturation factor